MSTETGFQIAWLDERYPFDCNARNSKVEQACINYFQSKENIRIVDLGAGTGSNFLYLSTRFPQNQYWIFIELNPKLILAAIKNIQTFANSNAYAFIETENELTLKKADQLISIQIKQVSFLDLGQHIDLGKTDLVTAGAVFDLLSPAMFEQMAMSLLDNKIALLATINYQGMYFKPVEAQDAYFIQQFEAHMTRPQHFGKAMGPACTLRMLDFYQKQKSIALIGQSDWQIKSTQIAMLQHLLNYLEEGIRAMLQGSKEKKDLQTWLTQKTKLLATPAYELVVQHQDIFAYPS